MLTTFISLDLLFLIPEIFLIFSIIIILIYSIFISTKYTLLNNKKYNTPIITTIITNLIIFTSFILIILYSQNLTNFQILFNGQFIISYYTQIGKIFIFGITILCLLTFNSYLKNNQINNYEYLILILI